MRLIHHISLYSTLCYFLMILMARVKTSQEGLHPVHQDQLLQWGNSMHFKFQDRVGESPIVKKSKRLGQQFFVDRWATIEQYRLTWFQNHQGRLRTELYSGIQDAITAGDVNAQSVGRRYILPSLFTGGPRYMMQHYQDAITICRAMGPPDFFVTIMCNLS